MLSFSVLLGTILVIVRLTLSPYQSDRFTDWLFDNSRLNTVRLAIHLIPIAGIVFLWFIGVFRNHLGMLEDQFFATVFLGSGLLFVASLFVTGAFSGSAVEAVADRHPLNSDSYSLVRLLIGAFLNVFAIKMAGVFMFSTSMIVFRTRILPRWLSFVGFLSATVLLLVITSWPWIALLFPLWMLVISTTVLLANSIGAAWPSDSSSKCP